MVPGTNLPFISFTYPGWQARERNIPQNDQLNHYTDIASGKSITRATGFRSCGDIFTW